MLKFFLFYPTRNTLFVVLNYYLQIIALTLIVDFSQFTPTYILPILSLSLTFLYKMLVFLYSTALLMLEAFHYSCTIFTNNDV